MITGTPRAAANLTPAPLALLQGLAVLLNTFTFLCSLSHTGHFSQPLHTDFMNQADVPLGYYRHFKGAIYRVAGLARDCESQQWMVYYQCCYGDWSYWLRSLDDFCAHVIKEGINQPRFVYLGQQVPAELAGKQDGI